MFHPYDNVHSKWSGGHVGVAWTCREEWEEVYACLYSSDPALVKKGVGRVSAWKARGQVPMVVEMTANLCECRVTDKERGGAFFQVLNLQYSMAITRFVNGIGDISRLNKSYLRTNLVTSVYVYGIPAWVVTLRHSGTHEKLPTLGALRAGAEFCLGWLRANYWRPQRLTIGEQQDRERSLEATPASPEKENRKPAQGINNHILRLTQGLCESRDQLIDLLVQSDYKKLSGYLKQKQLLQFSPSVNYTVRVPEYSDLTTLPTLCVGKGDLQIWHTQLLKAAKSSSSLKQRIVSAIICAAAYEECQSELMHYLCGWLDILWASELAVQQDVVGSQVCVIKIVDDDDGDNVDDGIEKGFLPGLLDWLALLQVAKEHPGYYLHAILTKIIQHAKWALSELVVSNVMQLSSLTTMSCRTGYIDHSTPNQDISSRGTDTSPHTGTQEDKVPDLWSLWDQEPATPHLDLRWTENDQHWNVVDDVRGWVECPIGVCPGQLMSADLFDLSLPSSGGDCIVINDDDDNSNALAYSQAQDFRLMEGPSPAQQSAMEDDMVIVTDDVVIVTDDDTEPCCLDKQQIQNLKNKTRIL